MRSKLCTALLMSCVLGGAALVYTGRSANSAPPVAVQRVKWEYARVHFWVGGGKQHSEIHYVHGTLDKMQIVQCHDTLEAMDTLGKDGWELILSEPSASGLQSPDHWFKRQIAP